MMPDADTVRDRYLFGADRSSSEYRQVLEITPSRARLLIPSSEAQGWKWLVSVGILVGYLALTWPASVVLTVVFATLPDVAAWIVAIVLVLVWILGLMILFYFWDRKSLLLLADEWSESTDVVLLGARSFGTFQDVRARTRNGEELHLVVDAPAPRFWQAVRLLEGRPAAAP